MRKYSKKHLYLILVLFFQSLSSYCEIKNPNISQDVNFWQFDSNSTLDASRPFSIFVDFEYTGGRLENAKLLTSGNWTYNFNVVSAGYAQLSIRFQDWSELIKQFPIGNCTIVSTASDGIKTKNISLNSYVTEANALKIENTTNAEWKNEMLNLDNLSSEYKIYFNQPDLSYGSIYFNDEDDVIVFQNPLVLDQELINKILLDRSVECQVFFSFGSQNGLATNFNIIKKSISYFYAVKRVCFMQISNDAPLKWNLSGGTLFFSDYGPYNFEITAPRDGDITDPKNDKIKTTQSNSFEWTMDSGSIDNKNTLDVEYPNGIYSFRNQTINLSGDLYPNNGNPIKLIKVNGRTPYWKNGKLVLNSKINNKLEWTPYYGASKKLLYEGIFFQIQYIDSDTLNQKMLFEKKSGIQDLSQKNFLPFNSFLIPQKKLIKNKEYFITIKYSMASDIKSTPFILAAGYENTTHFSAVAE